MVPYTGRRLHSESFPAPFTVGSREGTEIQKAKSPVMRSKAAVQLATTDKPSGCGNEIPADQKLKDKLADLLAADWNFTNSKTNNGTHSIHPYPAKFIPQIPRHLIQRIRPLKGSFVFDPFCGCGTTLLEAQAAGYPSIGVDLNPIASMIARVKTRPPSHPISPLAAQ